MQLWLWYVSKCPLPNTFAYPCEAPQVRRYRIFQTVNIDAIGSMPWTHIVFIGKPLPHTFQIFLTLSVWFLKGWTASQLIEAIIRRIWQEWKMRQQTYSRQSIQNFIIFGQHRHGQNANPPQSSWQILLNHVIRDFHNV